MWSRHARMMMKKSVCCLEVVNEENRIVDRQLLTRGVADDIEELLSQLTTEERANFETVRDELGMGLL